MKNKENRNNLIPTDEPFVENLNLVTGDKFLYNRTLLTDRQVKELCIDENLKSINKFLLILNEGDRIQKWSIFENLQFYITNLQDLTLALHEIQKYYSQLEEFLPILGQGIANFLKTQPNYLEKVSITLIFDLTYRALTTQGQIQIDDWDIVLQRISLYPYQDYFVAKCFDYINGSFSMNSSSDRRRTAFCFIKHLMRFSKNIKKLALIKVLFFNKDQSCQVRRLICEVMGRLILDEKDEQLWKGLWEYFNDKQEIVRQAAHKIICNTFYIANFEHLVQSITDQSLETQICKFLPSLLQTFRLQVKENQRSKRQIVSFINKIFKSKRTQNIVVLLTGLCSHQTMLILDEGLIYEEVNFGLLPVKTPLVFQTISRFYQYVKDVEFQESLKSQLYRSLRQTQFEYFGKSNDLAGIFDFSQEDQILLYLCLCTKLFEFSKWCQLEPLLKVFKTITFAQNLYEKASNFMLKLWLSCPAFLVDLVIDQILHLVLINRRNFDFLITIREKLLGSKFWNHRRNYIKFYSAVRNQTSFECHKFMPGLAYKNIVADKCLGVRLTLLENALVIYKHTDPENINQKNQIKQAVDKLLQDRDMEVRKQADKIKDLLLLIDRDVNFLVGAYDRNRELTSNESKLVQVATDPRKVIKTQNQISRSIAKSKRKICNQHQRRTINGTKIEIKDMSIDNITMASQNSLKSNNTATNLLPKKNNLFRCHSVKLKGPSKKI